ncbi:MAG: hypothetical protein ACE37F_32950 [Nannocystaceae bacterium]|nr:hypothetical protein [bacterium]
MLAAWARTWTVLGAFIGILAPTVAFASVEARITASRTSCVSPCAVMVSAEGTRSSATDNAWHELGYFFDFDDPGAGMWETTGAPKATQAGGPMAMHVFECEREQCVFVIGMRAQDSQGEVGDAWVEIVVDSPTFRYPPSQTVCVSSTSSFFDDGDDEPCPEGARTVQSLPEIGEFTGRRVLLRRGESFGRACVGFEEMRVLIEPFGNSDDPLPELEGVELGRAGSCGDTLPNNEQARSYGARWASDLTVSRLRTPSVAMGMAYENVSVIECDLDYADAPGGGEILLSENGRICTTQENLDCDMVPYPYGAYLVDNRVIGSRTNPPPFNISAFNCPMLNWVGLAGNVVERAVGHNYRSQGHWRGLWMHNEFRGVHSTAGKQKLTIRGTGLLDYEPVGVRGDHPECTSAQDGNISRYGLVADNIIGNADSPSDDGFKSGAHPQNRNSVEGLEDIIFERNVYIDIAGQPTTDITLAGRNLTCRANNVWSNPGDPSTNCRVGDHPQLPDEFDGPYQQDQVPPALPGELPRTGNETSTGGEDDLLVSCACTGAGSQAPWGLLLAALGFGAGRRRSRRL